MRKDEMLVIYNTKRSAAMGMYNQARRNYHIEKNPKLKKDHESDKDYYSARKAFCEEVLKDLSEMRCW